MDLKREIEDGRELYDAMKAKPGQEHAALVEYCARKALADATEQGASGGITKALLKLKEVNAAPLSYDEVLAIHRCREKLLSCGPKRRRNPLHRVAVIEYKALCADREWARWYVNRKKTAFALETEGGALVQPGSALPPWKHPHMSRDRDRCPYPSRGEIKDRVCRRYKISQRNFDILLSEDSKRNALLFYRRLVVFEHLEHEEARRQTLKATGVRADYFAKWLDEERNSLFI